MKWMIPATALWLGSCADPSQTIRVDGSSTVFPVSAAIEQELRGTDTPLRTEIHVSGTTAGFRKLCDGLIDIAEASRPVNAAELQACQAFGVDFVELPIAYDGIAVVVNRKNAFVDSISTDELRRIWEPAAAGSVLRWSQVRSGFPVEDLVLLAPGRDSGTFDYFTKAILGEEDAGRSDVTTSEDDEWLANGVREDPGALAYFGLAYYAEHRDTLKLLAVDDGDPSNGEGPVLPSAATVRDGTYQPLARPLFLYVRRDALDRPDVQTFIDFYLTHAGTVADRLGYVSLPPSA